MAKATGRFILSTLLGVIVAIPVLFLIKHAIRRGFCDDLAAIFAIYIALTVSILIDSRLKKRGEGK
ncbi:MAG: hypothetical protein NT002_03790 [candidate division Zixibacteria bacterium]|nr:hypothetical protein [candidate division Zixibacteria bacterium]